MEFPTSGGRVRGYLGFREVSQEEGDRIANSGWHSTTATLTAKFGNEIKTITAQGVRGPIAHLAAEIAQERK